MNSSALTTNMVLDYDNVDEHLVENSWVTKRRRAHEVTDFLNHGDSQLTVVQDIPLPRHPHSSGSNLSIPVYNRKQSIVIYGIPESTEKFPNDRILADLEKFQRCLEPILKDNEQITVHKAFRLGKINSNPSSLDRPRPLKIILGSEIQTQLLLDRKYMLKEYLPEVFFQPDYNKIERDKLKLTLRELKSRKERGETNIRILNGEIVVSQKPFLWKQPITMGARCDRKKMD
jgi:hypothetical protein